MLLTGKVKGREGKITGRSREVQVIVKMEGREGKITGRSREVQVIVKMEGRSALSFRFS